LKIKELFYKDIEREIKGGSLSLMTKEEAKAEQEF